jgi:hypothetical protein
MAFPLMRNRGPGTSPSSIALRTAVSADPAPSVPMSRSAVKPAIKSSRAASSAMIVRCGTDSCTVCKSSAPGCRNKCTCASINPGNSVRSPKIDHLSARRPLHRSTHLNDPLAQHQYFARFHEASALHVQQTSRVQHNGMRGCGLGWSLCGRKPTERQQE